MAASDYVPTFKNRLHLAGRPQMSTHPNHYRLQPCRNCPRWRKQSTVSLARRRPRFVRHLRPCTS
jgi:hypothetical protein